MQSSRSLQWIARLVMVALLAQPWLGQKAVAAAADELNAVVICTGTGFKTVSLPSDFDPSNEAAPPEGQHDAGGLDCPACMVQALSQLDDPAGINEPVVYRYWISEPPITDQCLALPLAFPQLHSRAPPAT